MFFLSNQFSFLMMMCSFGLIVCAILIHMRAVEFGLFQFKVMIFPQQISYCNQKLINFGTFIREYFRLKPVSSTDNIPHKQEKS